MRFLLALIFIIASTIWVASWIASWITSCEFFADAPTYLGVMFFCVVTCGIVAMAFLLFNEDYAHLLKGQTHEPYLQASLELG